MSRRSRPRRAHAIITLAVLLGVTTGCSASITGARASESGELERNERRWQAARLRSYSFEYRMMCFCVPDDTERVRITVHDGQVTSVTRVRDGQPARDRHRGWPTVEQLFGSVRRYLELNPDRLEVEYDPRHGYPRSIVLDIESLAVDDEVSETASSLQPLP